MHYPAGFQRPWLIPAPVYCSGIRHATQALRGHRALQGMKVVTYTVGLFQWVTAADVVAGLGRGGAITEVARIFPIRWRLHRTTGDHLFDHDHLPCLNKAPGGEPIEVHAACKPDASNLTS